MDICHLCDFSPAAITATIFAAFKFVFGFGSADMVDVPNEFNLVGALAAPGSEVEDMSATGDSTRD